MRLGRLFGMTPDELASRWSIAELVEQIAYDELLAEEAEEWQQRQRNS